MLFVRSLKALLIPSCDDPNAWCSHLTSSHTPLITCREFYVAGILAKWLPSLWPHTRGLPSCSVLKYLLPSTSPSPTAKSTLLAWLSSTLPNQALPSAEVRPCLLPRVDEADTDPLPQTLSKSLSTSRQMAASPYRLTLRAAPARSTTSAYSSTVTSRAATSPSPMAPPRPTTPAWATSCTRSLAAP